MKLNLSKKFFWDLTLILSTFCYSNLNLLSSPKKMIVSVPVANLRIKPIKAPDNLSYPILSNQNPLQDSQLLLGEYILAFDEKIDQKNGSVWIKIYALEQKCFNFINQTWTYKQGWIEKNQAIAVNKYPSSNLVVKNQWINVYAEKNSTNNIVAVLSIGTKLLGKKINKNRYKIFFPSKQIGYVQTIDVYPLKSNVYESEYDLRKKVHNTALTFLGTPYFWGGRSSYSSKGNIKQTGVDCSGFTNLVYRTVGLEIPRDARDQFLLCNKLKSGQEVTIGDLIFFAPKEAPQKITHVAMYIFDPLAKTQIIESTGEWPYRNRVISEILKFGKPIDKIISGEIRGKNVIYFGSFLNDPTLIMHLRNTSLKSSFAELKNKEDLT